MNMPASIRMNCNLGALRRTMIDGFVSRFTRLSLRNCGSLMICCGDGRVVGYAASFSSSMARMRGWLAEFSRRGIMIAE